MKAVGVASPAFPPTGPAEGSAGSAAAWPPREVEGGFANAFGGMLAGAAEALRASEAAAVAGLQGAMPVNQVVEAVMSAEQQLQIAVAVRDKLVAAYLEVSRMPI